MDRVTLGVSIAIVTVAAVAGLLNSTDALQPSLNIDMPQAETSGNLG